MLEERLKGLQWPLSTTIIWRRLGAASMSDYGASAAPPPHLPLYALREFECCLFGYRARAIVAAEHESSQAGAYYFDLTRGA